MPTIRRPIATREQVQTRTAEVAARRSKAPTAKPTARRAARVLHRSSPEETSQVVRAPNSDEVYGDAIRSQRMQPRPWRGGEYLHVSDLIHKCTRLRALVEEYRLTPPMQTLSLSDRITFAQGDAIHDVAKDLARDGAPQMTWGKWSCKCEFLKHDDPCAFSDIDQDEECPHCHSKVDRYHEVSIFDEEYGVVGNPDLLFWIPRTQALHVNEIKSMADKAWQELNRPVPDHVLQVVWYWLLLKRAGYRVTDRCGIIYFTKGWMFGNKLNYKEFSINPEEHLHRLDDMITDAKAYRAHRQALAARKPTTLPVRTCVSADGKDAKACVACDVCFGV